MGLRYILGNAASGKTDLVLSQITKSLKSGKNLIYIVPEQFTLQSENDLIKKSGKRAVLSVQVLSFNRLSYRVFSEVGFNREKSVDNIGKNMLIRKLTLDLCDELKYYNKSINKHGFIEDISRLITEFHRYGITCETLKAAADRPQMNRTVSDKLTDIARIYNLYTIFLREGCISSDDSLDYLAQVIDSSSYIKGADIWVDGFYGFTPQEIKVISGLLKHSDTFTVSLTADEGLIYYDDLSEFDRFYETKHTVNTLSKLARDLNTDIAEPVFLSSSDSPKAFISACENIYSETEEAAADILHLVRGKGFRFRDIAVSVTDTGAYSGVIRGIFSKYGIPVFIDVKEDVLSHPLIELCRSVVGVVCKSWSYESVFRMLKTDMLPLESGELFDFENYCIEFGISGKKWHYEQWQCGFNGGRYDKEKINSMRDLVKRCVEPFTQGMKRASKLTVREFLTRLYNVLTNLEVTETLQKWIYRETLSQNNLAARRHKQIWGKLCGVFDEMAQLLGDETMDALGFAQVLDSGLASLDMGHIPPSKDQVLAGDLERTRLPDIKALLVLGMNEGALSPADSGIFLDYERQPLRDAGINLAECAHVKTQRQELYIYSLFAKPSDYLIIKYPAGSVEGKSMYPAALLDGIKEIYPNTENRFLPEGFVKTKKTMLSYAGELLHKKRLNAPLDARDSAILDFYRSDTEYKVFFQKMKKLVYGEDISVNLSEDTVKKLYGDELISNVSRLESYIKCPFSYFVKYNLNASQRRVYQADYVDIGNLFHDILREFSKLLELYAVPWKQLNKTVIKRFAEESLEVIMKDAEHSVFGESGANEYLLKRILRVSEKSIWALAEHIKAGDFVPYGFEHGFESHAITGITVDAGSDRKFILTGRIDRIDVMGLGDTAYVKIIDYKSGAMKFSFSDMYYGMQSQLMMYLDAFIKSSKITPKKLPGGIFYFNIDDPVINFDDLGFNTGVFDERMQGEINEKILSKFAMSGLTLADIDIVKGLDRDITQNGRSRVISNLRLLSEEEAELAKNSAAATADEFALLREYVNLKMRETGSDIMKGKIDKHPYKDAKSTGCDYCGFAAVCKFDLVYETMKYRNFKKIGTLGEMIDEIRK